MVDVADGEAGQPLIGSLVVRGRDVALDQLYDGLAWSTVPTDEEGGEHTHPYTKAEGEARAARRGLWAEPQPIPPWDWRRGAARH